MTSWKRGFSITASSLKSAKKCPCFGSNQFKSLSSNILPSDFPLRDLNPVKYLNQKFRQVVDFYEEFSGLKDVRLAQEKVEEVGEKLVVFQSERRKAFALLSDIQSNLKAVYAQLEYTKRGDDRYIHLITEENKLIKQEEMLQEKFKDIEKAERDQFTLFTHSVKAAHEKEKTQSQRTKYWSLIGSVVGTLIGIIGSSLNTHKKQSELKKLIADTSNSKLDSQLTKFLESYRQVEHSKYLEETNKIRDNVINDIMNNVSNKGKMHEYLNEILLKTNNILINSENTLKIMQNISQFELYKINSDSGSNALFMNLQSFKDTVCFENEQMRNIIWKASCVIGGAIILRLLLPH